MIKNSKNNMYSIGCKDYNDFILHSKGKDFYLALWDISQELRNKWKYQEPENPTWWEAYQLFWDVLKDYGITLEEVS